MMSPKMLSGASQAGRLSAPSALRIVLARPLGLKMNPASTPNTNALTSAEEDDRADDGASPHVAQHRC